MKISFLNIMLLFSFFSIGLNSVAQVEAPVVMDSVEVITHHYFRATDPLNIFDSYTTEEDEYGFHPEYAIEGFRIDRVGPFLILGIVLSVLSLLALIYGRRKYPEKDNLLKNSADYIQKYQYTGLIRGRKKPILKFFVKDNKMGLMDVAHYCVFLPAQYDVLEWREKNKYLNATVGNRTFIIDINGNELK